MTDTVLAEASPEKRLFISLLTRDISMVSAFLDLIDNSVNAALEPLANRLETADGYADILEDETVQPRTDIRLTLSDKKVIIADNAPGIRLSTAQQHVFKFGRSEEEESESDRLSVYGLGLKRAFFKLGNRIKIESDHMEGGFELDLDVAKWAKNAGLPWQFELTPREPVEAERCGTKIEVWRLHEEAKMRLGDGVFEGHLKDAIGKTYSYYLSKFVRILVNQKVVEGISLRVGKNNSTDRFERNGVTCTITAGLGTPEGGKYRDGGSGWFVLCNGRTVISADKSSMTGWNNNGLPIFQPKHRPFLGTVYFVSKYSERLPWDTTKSGINEDSEIWQQAKRLMVVVGRSVTSFLDARYTDEGTEIAQKELEKATKERVDAMKASTAERKEFKVPKKPPKKIMKIQYDAKIDHVESIAKYLARPGMSGSDVGRHTFHYFLRNEVGEE